MHLIKISPGIASLAFLICTTALAEPQGSQSVNRPCFLLERFKAVTECGIVGIPSGTEVEILGKTAGTLRVKTKEGTTFDVSAEKLTSDPATAQANRQKDEAADAESQAKRDAIVAAQRAKKLEHYKQIESTIDSISATASATNIAPVTGSSAPFVPNGTALDQAPRHVSSVKRREKPSETK